MNQQIDQNKLSSMIPPDGSNDRFIIQDQPTQKIQIEPTNKQKNEICTICFETLQLFPICSKQHKFCKNCIQNHINLSLKSLKRLICPSDECTQQIKDYLIKLNYFNETQKKKLDKINQYFLVIQNNKFRFCSKPNCDGKIDLSLPQLQCDRCNSIHCSKCYELSHPQSCVKRLALELQLTRKYRQCKKCKQVIQKTEGCTHMTCTCGHYFCYSCGQTLNQSNHKCIAPAEMDCQHKLRWQIQHEELWYQTNELNFLRYLNCVEPNHERSFIVRFIWCIFYVIFIYPFSIFLAFMGCIIFFTLLISFFGIFITILPFLGLCPDNHLQLFPAQCLLQNTNCFISLIVIIIFYPIILIINIIQFIFFTACADPTSIAQFCELFCDLSYGIRNFICIPCLMFTDNSSYYLRKQRQKKFDLQNQSI